MPASLEDQVVAALRRIARAIDMHSRELLQQCGLTTPQLLTMRALVQMEPITVSGLASSISVSQATMTGILDRLEQQNLISRSRDPDDRRSTLISSTQSGKEFIAKAPPILQDRFRSELSKSTAEEQASILATLQRIARMMGAEELHAAPILTSGAEGLADPDPDPSS